MSVWDNYSHRKRVREGDVPDVYTYDELPEKLRVQIVQICRAAIGRFHTYSGMEFGQVTQNNEGWSFIHGTVAREHGVLNSHLDMAALTTSAPTSFSRTSRWARCST